jgi:hypothetical protein
MITITLSSRSVPQCSWRPSPSLLNLFHSVYEHRLPPCLTCSLCLWTPPPSLLNLSHSVYEHHLPPCLTCPTLFMNTTSLPVLLFLFFCFVFTVHKLSSCLQCTAFKGEHHLFIMTLACNFPLCVLCLSRYFIGMPYNFLVWCFGYLLSSLLLFNFVASKSKGIVVTRRMHK